MPKGLYFTAVFFSGTVSPCFSLLY